MKFNITLKNIAIKLIFLFCINCINGFHVSVIQVRTFSILYQYIIFFLYIVIGKIMIVKSKQLNDLTRVYYVENHRSWKKSINERF